MACYTEAQYIKYFVEQNPGKMGKVVETQHQAGKHTA